MKNMNQIDPNKQLKFGVRDCPFCGEETSDWRIECTICGKIFPSFVDLINKTEADDEREFIPEEEKPKKSDT